MEEIDLNELFLMFWSKKIQIILIIVSFAIIGGIYTFYFTTPMYSSSTTLVLVASSDSKLNDSSSSITTTDLTLNSKLVATYSELVKSKNVLRQVISNLDININEDTLKKNVKVSSVKDTELIEIVVTNENTYVAEKIANEIARVFTDMVKNIYKLENVQVIDKAEAELSPSNINHERDIIIFSGVGLVIAVAYVFIMNMFDTTIKTAEEIENIYKIPVLASIPEYEEGQHKTKKGGKR